MKTKIKEIMAGVFGLPVEEIGDDAVAGTPVQWDSLNHLNLIVALEEEFGVEFSEQQIPEVTSLAKLLDALEANLSN